MKRFLVHENLVVGHRIQLPLEEARHAFRVLRLGEGDEILLTDGRGVEAHGKIVESSKEGTWVEILSVTVRAGTKAGAVEIIQALLKGPRMDWLVEKLTELGVDTLHPIQSEHSVANADKEERWTRLVQSAVKQSGNLRSLRLTGLKPLADALTAEKDQLGEKFLLSPSATTSLAQALSGDPKNRSARVVLAIGPEGGFSAAEEAEFIRQGFQPVALSRQILRGETAGMAAAAIALHLLDF